MFYHLVLPLKEYVSYFRLFQYISFRSMAAALTALVLVLIFGSMMIRWLQRLKLGEEIRQLGPESHKSKAGTPTMGGIIIIGAVIVSIILWGNFANHYLVALIAATVLLTALGFVDDYIKTVRKQKDGVHPRAKLFFQIIIAAGVACSIYFFPSKRAKKEFSPLVGRSSSTLQEQKRNKGCYFI